MSEKTKHHWIGYQYDNTVCNHCRIDLYHALPDVPGEPACVQSEYCEDFPAELAERLALKESYPDRLKEALDKCRGVLSPEEWNILRLSYFGLYRERSYIRI